MIEMADRMGDSPAPHPPHRRVRLGEGRAPRAGSRRDAGRRSSCEHLTRTGFAGHVVLEINTRRCANREEREADLAESLEFARTHLGVTDPVS